MSTGLKKFRVIYEIGEADIGGVTRHAAETMAATMAKAIDNVWYRTGRSDTFRVCEAVVV